MLQFGEHSQKKNMAVVRRVNAKTFAQAGTAAEALKLMEANKVPLEERPPAWQIKNFRPSKGRVQEREVADCIHSLQEFLRSPPENIFVWEQPICGADKIQIGFSSKLAMERLSSCNLDSFVMDFTFQVGKQGLSLGGIGPLGLKLDNKSCPRMRMMPSMFMLTRSEDQDGQKALFLKYAETMKSFGVVLKHGYLDCFCMEGVAAAVQVSSDSFTELKLHRLGVSTKRKEFLVWTSRLLVSVGIKTRVNSSTIAVGRISYRVFFRINPAVNSVDWPPRWFGKELALESILRISTSVCLPKN